jgi:feruloyl esterase
LICKEGKSESCLSPEKVAAIKKAVAGPKTSGGVQVYPGFLYDTGITPSGPIRGSLSPGPGIFGPATTAMEIDVEKEALADIQPLVDSMSTNAAPWA